MIVPKVLVRFSDYEKKKQSYTRDLKGRWAKQDAVLGEPVLNLITDFFQEQFDTDGAAGGQKWQKLATSTLRIKAALGKDNGILRREGDMYDALTKRGMGVTGRRVEFIKNGLRFRITNRLASIHNTGAKNGKPPQRVIQPDEMPEEFMVKLRSLVRNYIVEVRFRDFEET